MAQLLQKRHELANVLGLLLDSLYITADKMVATPNRTPPTFIGKIKQQAQAGSKHNYEE